MKTKNKINFYSKLSTTLNTYRISITEVALNQMQYLLKKNINNLGIKLDIQKSGCAGFRFTLQIIQKIQFKQFVTFTALDNSLIKIFVPTNVCTKIHRTEIDFVKNGLNFNFEFNTPKAKNFCGCRESFNLI